MIANKSAEGGYDPILDFAGILEKFEVRRA